MQYRKDLSVCHVSIVIICTVDIVGKSPVIAASTVGIVNIYSVSSVCIFAVGSFGIGYGIIVTVCTSCNVSQNNVCIVNLSSVSILSVYNVRMCTVGNVGKRNVSTVSNCIVSSVRTSSVCIVTRCTSSIVSVFTVCNLRYM